MWLIGNSRLFPTASKPKMNRCHFAMIRGPANVLTPSLGWATLAAQKTQPAMNILFGVPPVLVVGALVLCSSSPQCAEHRVWADSPAPQPPFATWETAAHDLQTAVNAAADDATVLVTNGVYATGGAAAPGQTVLNRVVVTRRLTLSSVNGPGVTEIVGAGPLGGAAVRGVYLTNGAALRGFTVRGGHTSTGGTASDQRGGGVFIEGQGTVSNCVIRANRAASRAGGIYAVGGGGRIMNSVVAENEAAEFAGAYLVDGGEVAYCTIVSNTAAGNGAGVVFWNHGTVRDSLIAANTAWDNDAGVSFRTTGTGRIERCEIVGNYALNSGGGVHLRSGDVLADSTVRDNVGDWWVGGGVFCEKGGTVTNCLVLGNIAGYGGGVRLDYGGRVDRSVIRDNYAWYAGAGVHSDRGGPVASSYLFNNWSRELGGGVVLNYGGTIENCALIDNHAEFQGGAILFYGPKGIVRQCTITGNSAGRSGAAWQGANAEVTVVNSIAWGNSGLAPFDGTVGTNRFNCLETWTGGGEGILTTDPKLTQGYRLAPDSPCRGAGLAGSSTGADIDGEAWASPPSMGCDELVPGATPGPLGVAFVAPQADYRTVRIATRYACEFLALVTGRADRIEWDFGDGVKGADGMSLWHAWEAPGDYPVVLTAFNADHPAGVSVTNVVNVEAPGACYVDAAGQNPVPPYTTWATAATNIQDAIDACVLGGTVVVTNGTYRGGPYEKAENRALRSRIVITRDITVRSVNGPTQTAIVGAGDWNGSRLVSGPRAVRCVFMNTGTLSGFTLADGHTLTNGTYTGTWEYEQSGGGAYAFGGVLTNCIVKRCSAYVWAGGVIGGTLLNCTIDGNYGASTAGGAMFATLHNCVVTNNVSREWGGGVHECQVFDSTLVNNRSGAVGQGGAGGGAGNSTLVRTLVQGNSANWGGGLSHSTAIDCTFLTNAAAYGGGANVAQLTNCVLRGNSATGNGGGANEGTLDRCLLEGNTSVGYGGGAAFATVLNSIVRSNAATGGRQVGVGGGLLVGYGRPARNCLILGNQAWSTGGVRFWDHTPVQHCTIVSNSFDYGAVSGPYAGTLENCIVWGQDRSVTAITTNRYNCLQGWTGGDEGVLSYDPGFLGPAGGDFRLRADSPLIGAALGLDWTAGATDLAGAPRLVGQRPDIGAYEVGALAVHFAADRTRGIQGLTNVTFTAIATGTNVAGLEYRWDLDGDGTPEVVGSGLTQTTHTYSAPGVWPVSLEVRNAAGESAWATLPGGIRVYPPVEADFASTQRRWSVPVTIQFTDHSRYEPQSWAWDFNGDGIIDSTERNPSWYYTNTGNYTVSLTVSNDFGTGGRSVSTITRTNFIQLPDTVQVVRFEADPPMVPVGQPVRFVNQTTNLHGNVTYAWDFNNDGVIDSREENPVWTFDSSGFQSVWMTVRDDTGENTLAKTQGVRVYRPLYVNSASPSPTAPYATWKTAARTLQQAIVAAAPADVIWVTNGVYSTGSVRAGKSDDDSNNPASCLSRVALTNAVRVESVNGPAWTRIVGAPSPDAGGFGSNSVRCVYLVSGAELVGFTLTNGYAGGSGPWGETSGNGGGAYLDRGGSISNCVVVACAAIGDEGSRGGGDGGGGVFLNQGGTVRYSTILSNRTDYGDGGGVHANLGGTVEFCEITGNSAGSPDEDCDGGGVYLKGEGAALRDCLVEGNTANEFGGGICLYWVGTVVERCRVYRNSAPYGGGLGLPYGSQPAHRVANCDIAYNRADEWGGGIASDSSHLMLDGCWIHENLGGAEGGGLASGGGSVTVVNSTIERNEATTAAGGVTAGAFRNCIVVNNRLAGPDPDRGTENYVANAVSFQNSCTYPLPPSNSGGGNFADDPQLAGPDGPHLLPASPCIDRGLNWTNLLALDIDGEPRVWPPGGALDVGCDEFVPGGATGPLAAALLTTLTNAVVGAPLEFRAEFNGWPGGLEWRFQQPDGSTAVVPNAKTAQHRWTAPGDYQVTLWATNRTGQTSTTVSVHVVEAYTNYVSLAGAHVPPFDSWTTAATNLETAVAAMNHAGGTIALDDGTFPLAAEVRVAKPLALAGRNGREATTLAGVPREVVTEEWDEFTGETYTVTNLVSDRLLRIENAEVILRGLTFTNGQARGYQPHGGAVWLEGPGRILDCAFLGNRADESGGAVYLDGGWVSNCVFAGNWASSGGGLAAVNGARVLGSRFETNAAGQRGGGVLLASGATLESSELTGNTALYGGGVASLDGGPVRSSRIRGNTAGQAYQQGFEWEEYLVGGEGGGAHWARLEDCELANNSTLNGGGFYGGSACRCIIRDNIASENGGGGRADGLTVVENCAVFGNLAGGKGGGLWLPAGAVAQHVTVFENTSGDLGAGVFAEPAASIRNSISAHNRGPAQTNASGGAWSHSCVNSPPAGEGNFADDPRLAGPRDFHLLASSPCVDRAARLDVGTDLEGEPRPWPEGAPPDVGCDEVKFGTLDGPLTVAIGGSLTQVVAGTTLEFGADIEGRALGSLWTIQTNGGLLRLSDAYAAQATWPLPGDYAITLVASNQSATVSTALTVRVLTSFTNYVSLAGRHNPPFLTWEDAATNIQAAVDAAVAGGTVLIGDGRYVGAPEVKINKPLAVRGANGRNAAIVDGTGNGPGTLYWADLPDPYAFCSTLVTRGDPVSAYLLGRLSPTAGRGLAQMLMYGYLSLYYQQRVVDELNAILNGESIYDAQRFTGVALSAETQALLAQAPTGALQLRLNRLLFNDAFAGLVGPIRGGSRCFSLWHPAARLEGLTITRGRAWVDAPQEPRSSPGRPKPINLPALVKLHAERGGGVFLAAGGTVRDCRLLENEAKSGGGGVSFNGAGLVEDCEFVGNHGGGAYGFYGGELFRSAFTENDAGIDGIDLRVRDCAVVNNPGRGASILGQAGLVTGSTFASNRLGILVAGGARLADSLVQGNTEGGVRCQAGSVVSNTTVRANSPWGLDLEGGAATDCLIEANWSTNANGAGTLLRATRALLERSVVRDNRTARSGAGVFCEGEGTVRNCQVLENEAGERGGGVWLGAGGVIENSALLGNRATSAGGGLYGLTNSVARNCTVADNSAAQHGGGIFLEPGGAARNCIVQFNDAYAGPNCGAGVFPTNTVAVGAFEYCCASPAPPGPGNFAADPWLMGRRNPHLASSSPCIGAGHNRYANGTDLDGDARILPADGRVDIGCDEWTGLETGPLSGALVAMHDRAVVGIPLEFRADLDGRAQGFEWVVQTPDGVQVLPGLTTLHRAWSQPGSYAVTLRATNALGAVSFTTNILIGAESSAFVSATGAHLAPFNSWVTAATNVQAAVDAAWPGGIVWIDDGVIDEPGEVVLDKPLTIRGRNGRAFSRIDGGGAHRVFRLAHPQAVLRSITIANGRAERGGGVLVERDGQILDCAIVENRAAEGGGLYLDGGGLVSATLVQNNSATTNAGGVFLRYDGQILDCLIHANQTGDTGGGVYLQDSGLLARCSLVGNTATNRAGGAYLLRGGTCESSRIEANTAARRGGGLFLDGAGTLTHSVVSSNVTLLPYDENNWAATDTYGGAGVYLTGAAQMDNCLVVGNASAHRGGGAFLPAGGSMFNCTLTANSAARFGGGVAGGGARSVFNCIIKGNTAGYGWRDNFEENGDAFVHCITGHSRFFAPGNNCIDVDPQFADPAAGDFRLKPASPALNAGTNELTRTATDYIDGQWVTRTNVVGTVGETDLDGRIRIGRGVVDIGAFEFQFEPVAFTLADGLLVWPGTRDITWIQNDPDARIDLEAWQEGQVSAIASALVRTAHHAWDTTTVPDGYYDLRIRARAATGETVGEDRRSVFINNTLDWHSGELASSETWEPGTVHLVTGDLWVGPGVTLTLAPGAIVKFAPGARLRILEGGTLSAPATLEAPVVLTPFTDDTVGGDSNLDGNTTQPRPGAWGGIGGEGGTIDLTEAVDLRYTQSTTGGTLAASESWLGSQVHYVTEDLVVPAGVTLTINPGAIVKLADKRSIVVTSGGRLNAIGNAAQPVVFTSDKDDSLGGDTNGDGDQSLPAAGDWQSLFADGGTIALDHAVLTYSAGTPSGTWNQTGAIRTRGTAQVTVLNSTIRDAFFEGFSVWGSGARVAVTNTVIANCDRGVTPDAGTTVTFVNSTFYGNRIGVWAHSGKTELVNCIVSHSLEAGIDCVLATPLTVSYSDVWSPTGQNYVRTADLTGQNGNLSLDPKFRAPESGGFQLDYLSPAIDAADGRRSPELDAQGMARFDDPRTTNRGLPDLGGKCPDLGAYEFNETAGSDVDLVVTSVQGPARVTAGDTVSVSWTLRNAGTRALNGSWHDAVSLFDAQAPNAQAIVGEQEFVTQGRLGPGQELTVTRALFVPGATEGPYRWRVQANRRAEIFEGTLGTNNVALADGPVNLVVPELQMGEIHRGDFKGIGRELMFKFRPPPGRNLLVEVLPEYVLDTRLSGCQASLNLLIAAGRAPVGDDYDAQSQTWLSFAAGTVLDRAQDAWHYVKINPRWLFAVGTTSTGSYISRVGYTLRVAVFEDFDLTGIELAAGGNTGDVTVPIDGAGFHAGLDVALVAPGQEALPARSIHFENSARAFATFDLRGQPVGPRDVRATLGASVRTLPGAFTVEPGRPLSFEAAVAMPQFLRVDHRFEFMVRYRNTGNVDLKAPGLVVTGDCLVRERTDRPWGQSLSLSALSEDGPKGTLRPGAEGSFRLLGRTFVAGPSQVSISVRYFLHDNPAPMDWDELMYYVAPQVITRPWHEAFDALAAAAGPTVGGYVSMLAESLNRYYSDTRGMQRYTQAGDTAEIFRTMFWEFYDDWRTRISGRVYLGSEAYALDGAKVVARGIDNTNAVSGISRYDGRVRLPDLPAGTYQLEFVDLLPPAGPLVIALGEEPVAGLTWIVPRGGTIRGRVTLPFDLTMPEPGLIVVSGAAGFRRLATPGSDLEFEIEQVPDGVHRVTYQSSQVPVCTADVVVTNAGTAYVNLTARSGGSIAGRVTDAATGASISDVAVSVLSAVSRSGFTDTNGLYTITGVEPGSHTVRARGRGYWGSAVSNVVVSPGALTPQVDLAVVRSATLAGRVVDANSSHPIANAVLVVTRGGQETLGMATTGDDGRFRFDDLPPGTATLEAHGSRYGSTTASIGLLSGLTNEQHLALARVPVVAGTITNSVSGAPLPGIPVVLLAANGTNQWQTTDAMGHFEFSPAPLGSALFALLDGSHRHELNLDSPTATLTIDLGLPVGEVTGRLRTPGGSNAVAGAEIRLQKDGATCLRTASGADGSFAFRNVVAGRYALEAVAAGYWFAVQTNVAAIAGQNARLPDMLSGDLSLSVLLSPASGDPPASGGVQLIRPTPPADTAAWQPGKIDSSGRATLAGAVAGAYWLQVSAPGLASALIPITLPVVDPNLDVPLTPTATVTGLVTRASTGLPVPYAEVVLFGRSERFEVLRTVADEQGAYTLTDAPPGVWQVIVRPAGSTNPLAPLVLPELELHGDERRSLDVSLKPPSQRVPGRLTAADGSVPLQADVLLVDASGAVLARTPANALGEFEFGVADTGVAEIIVAAEGFHSTPVPVAWAPGPAPSEVSVPVAWVGLAGRPPTPAGSATSVARVGLQGRGPLDWLKNFDITEIIPESWINESGLINELAETVRMALGEPVENDPNIAWDQEMKELINKCPKAHAWFNRYSTLQKACRTGFDAWHKEWEGGWIQNSANLGEFGVSLLKFAGSLLALQSNAGSVVKNFDSEAKMVSEQVGRNVARLDEVEKLLAKPGSSPADTARWLQEQAALVADNNMIKEFTNMVNLADSVVKLIGGTTTAGANATGVPGAIDGIEEDAEDGNWGDLVLDSVQMTLEVTTIVNDAVSFLGKRRLPFMEKYVGYLGALNDGISTLRKAADGVADYSTNLVVLQDKELDYKECVRRRDEALQWVYFELGRCGKCVTGNCDTPPPCPHGCDDGGGSGHGNTVVSEDPNDKLTVGYGAAGYVPPGAWLSYTIRFENRASASAPAQLVTITDPLPPALDLATVELTGIGFNNVDLDVPPGLTAFSTVTHVSTDPNPVAVQAALDAATGVLTWQFESFDSLTRTFPDDPFAGFLPPNTTNQIGEGYVSYRVRSRADLANGMVVTNAARIVFDVNAPIDTPPAVNTIDDIVPSSQVTAESLPGLRDYRLRWPGTDGLGGAGLEAYTVYCSIDGGPWERWLGPTDLTMALFRGDCGHTYAFYSVARDAVGNLESPPPLPDVTLALPANAPPALAPIAETVAHVGRLLLITNQVEHADPEQAVTFSLDPGAPRAMTIDAQTGVIRWRPDCADGGAEYAVAVRATDDGCGLLSSSQSFRIRVTECLRVDPGDATGMPGETVCVPVDLISGLPLTNLVFVIEVPPGRFTNATIQAAAPDVGGTRIESVGSTQFVAQVWAKPGALLRGPLTVANLCLTLLGGQGSAFVPLEVADILGTTIEGADVPSTFPSFGTVRAIEVEPLLEIEHGPGPSVTLIVYSPPGTTHQLWQTSNPANGPWTAIRSVVSTQRIERLSLPVEPGAARFYQLR